MTKQESEQRIEIEAPAGLILDRAAVTGLVLADTLQSIDVGPPTWLGDFARGAADSLLLSSPGGLLQSMAEEELGLTAKLSLSDSLAWPLVEEELGSAAKLLLSDSLTGPLRAIGQLTADIGAQSLAGRISEQLLPGSALDRLLADNQRQMSAAIDALNMPSLWPWTATQPQPLPRPIETVQVDSQITLDGLGHALAEGRLPVRDVMRLCLQHVPASKPGVKEPPIEEQLALVEGWHSSRGRMLQEVYCGKMGISRATLNRYERTCRALGLL